MCMPMNLAAGLGRQGHRLHIGSAAALTSQVSILVVHGSNKDQACTRCSTGELRQRPFPKKPQANVLSMQLGVGLSIAGILYSSLTSAGKAATAGATPASTTQQQVGLCRLLHAYSVHSKSQAPLTLQLEALDQEALNNSTFKHWGIDTPIQQPDSRS